MSESDFFIETKSIQYTEDAFVKYKEGTREEVGYARVITFRNNDNEKLRGLIFVHIESKYRMQGHGSKLLERAIEHTRKIGCDAIFVVVSYAQKAMRPMLEDAGFTRSGEEFKLNF